MNKQILSGLVLLLAVLMLWAGIQHTLLWAGVGFVVGIVVLVMAGVKVFNPTILVGLMMSLSILFPATTIYVFPPRMYVIALIGLVLVYDYIKHPELDELEVQLLIWMLLMMSLNIVINSYVNTSKHYTLFMSVKIVLRAWVAGVIVAIFIFRKIRRENDLVLICKFMAITFTLTAIVAVLQMNGVAWAWSLPLQLYKLGTSAPDKEFFLSPLVLGIKRPKGLYTVTIALAFGASITGPVAVSLALFFSESKEKRLFYSIVAIIVSIGGLASATRSLLVGYLASYTYLLWKFLGNRDLRHRGLWNFVIVMTFLASIVGGVYIIVEGKVGGRLTNYHDTSRPALWKAALVVSMNHPWGIGTGSTTEIVKAEKLNYVGRIDVDLASKLTSHNAWLNQLVYMGVPGLLGFLFLTLWPFVLTRRDLDPERVKIKYLVRASLISLYAHSTFHNGGLLGEPYAWFAIGFAMVYELWGRDSGNGDVNAEPPA